MALPPKFAAHKLLFAPPPTTTSSVPPAAHTLELYLDYCCPFSAKLFRTLRTVVDPLVRADPTWSRSFAVIFRQQVQPWHPSSTLLHEAALAVLRLAPERFWEFSAALFDAQKSFFDINVVNETRNSTYRRLAKVAGGVGVDEAKVYELLAIPEKPESDDRLNVGNGVTNDLKVVTKMNRLIGVHVTPTGVFDGVVQDISSSWGETEWKEWLTKNVIMADLDNLDPSRASSTLLHRKSTTLKTFLTRPSQALTNCIAMLRQFTTSSPRLLFQIIRKHTTGVCRPATQCAQLLRRPRGHTVLFRLYSNKAAPPSQLSKAAQAVSKRQAGATAAQSKASPEIPERLLIYHAGTGRTTVLAMFKVTTLFVGVFFLCVAVPGYVQADKPIEETAKIALCGVVPLLFVTYTTAPFVTHLHMHLPAAARTSRGALERFVSSGPPPGTRLTATTVSVIGKPRYSALRAGDLLLARRGRRFGLVNYTRNVTAENATRKWYELPAVRQFHIPDSAQQTTGRGAGSAKKGGRNLVEPWIWDAIKERIAKRAGEQAAAS